MLERNLLKRCGYETSWQHFPRQDPLLAICPRVLVCNAPIPARERWVERISRSKPALTSEFLKPPKERKSWPPREKYNEDFAGKFNGLGSLV
jgi:hypothetical protein